MWLISALLFASLVGAQPNDSLTIKNPEPEAPPRGPHQTAEISLNTELRYLSTDVVQRRGEEGGRLYELSTRMRFEPDPLVGISIDAGVEDFGDDSRFIFRKAEVDLHPIERVELRAGQTYIPLGYFTENDRWMAELPHYYSILLPWKKGIDLGARAMIRPFNNDHLILDGSTFSGRTVRPGDERPGPAESRPVLGQLRSEGRYWSAFAALWEHDLAYRDRVEARGIGLSLKYNFESLDLEPLMQIEGFLIEEKQQTGPMQISRAGSALAQIRWRRVVAGGLYGQSLREATVNRQTFALEPIFERTFYGEVILHRSLRLRAEKRKIDDGERSVDDVVWRALFDIQVL